MMIIKVSTKAPTGNLIHNLKVDFQKTKMSVPLSMMSLAQYNKTIKRSNFRATKCGVEFISV